MLSRPLSRGRDRQCVVERDRRCTFTITCVGSRTSRTDYGAASVALPVRGGCCVVQDKLRTGTSLQIRLERARPLLRDPDVHARSSRNSSFRSARNDSQLNGVTMLNRESHTNTFAWV